MDSKCSAVIRETALSEPFLDLAATLRDVSEQWKARALAAEEQVGALRETLETLINKWRFGTLAIGPPSPENAAIRRCADQLLLIAQTLPEAPRHDRQSSAPELAVAVRPPEPEP